MQESIFDRLRIFVAAKYLDWAEMLPDFNGGVVAHLQSIRKHQRKWAVEAQKRSRPPSGLEFRYSRLRLFEMFPIEDFESLERGVRKLFPEQPLEPNRFERLRVSAASLSQSGYYNVGLLVRNKRGVFSSPVRVLPNLRPEVETLEVEVIKALPSMFIVCFSAKLSDEATARIKKVQERCYLGQVRFRNWLPSSRGGHSESPAETAAIEGMVGWLNRLRSDIEESLRPFCKGFFFKQQTDPKEPALPAMEEFYLENVPTADKEFEDWLECANDWARSLGFDLPPYERFKSKGTMLLLGTFPFLEATTAHRFLVLRDSSQAEGEHSDSEYFTREESLRSTALLLLPIEFINTVKKTVEELRVQIYRSFAKDRSLHGFRKSIRLHNQLQRQALLLNRLSVELEQWREFMAHETSSLLEYVGCDPRVKGNLQESLLNSLEHRIRTLRKHIDVVSSAHTSHLTSRNMDLTFRLQRQMFVWTIVVTTATIAGVLGWERTSHLLSTLPRLLHLH